MANSFRDISNLSGDDYLRARRGLMDNRNSRRRSQSPNRYNRSRSYSPSSRYGAFNARNYGSRSPSRSRSNSPRRYSPRSYSPGRYNGKYYNGNKYSNGHDNMYGYKSGRYSPRSPRYNHKEYCGVGQSSCGCGHFNGKNYGFGNGQSFNQGLGQGKFNQGKFNQGNGQSFKQGPLGGNYSWSDNRSARSPRSLSRSSPRRSPSPRRSLPQLPRLQ